MVEDAVCRIPSFQGHPWYIGKAVPTLGVTGEPEDQTGSGMGW